MNRYVTPHNSDFIFPASEIPGPAEGDDGSKPRSEGRLGEPSAIGSAAPNPLPNPRGSGLPQAHRERLQSALDELNRAIADVMKAGAPSIRITAHANYNEEYCRIVLSVETGREQLE